MRSFPLNRPPLYTRLLLRFRRYAPKLLTLLILLFSIAPTYIPGYSSVRPNLVMIPVFYWAVYRPYSFSVISAFFTGMALDLLKSSPLGVNTLVFTLLYLAADSQRRFLMNKTFLFVWFGFAVLSFAAYFFKWLFVSINFAAFTPAGAALISYFLLVAAYPLVVWPCAKLHLYLLDREK